MPLDLLRRFLAPIAVAPVIALALTIIAPDSTHVASAQGYGGYESYDNEPYDPAADGEDEYEDGREVPDVTYFYDELEDDGRWLSHPTYGQVWTPNGVSRDWRPYTRGRWANTSEYGWYWVSDEPFGWATYHYGRWYRDGRYGWVWVPGTRWGPAWVAWRSSDDYIGWAPLPPEARWRASGGLVYSKAIYESPSFSIYWNFSRPAYITSPTLVRYYVPRRDVTRIIYRTRPRTTYVVVNRRVVNRGVSVTRIERVTKTKVKTVRIRSSNNRTIKRTKVVKKNEITVFRPKLTRYRASRDRKKGATKINRTLWKDVDKRKVKVRKTKSGPPDADWKTPVGTPAHKNAKGTTTNKTPGTYTRTLPPGLDAKQKKKKKKKARKTQDGGNDVTAVAPGDDPNLNKKKNKRNKKAKGKKNKKGKKAQRAEQQVQGDNPANNGEPAKKKKKKKKKKKNKNKNGDDG